ncbi:hypothetical protein [Lentilactobacillus sp. Marseille-Q4993]|uniref:hypothetical protein n=1 Tax=Lentilactobacillus sp. Marseille-Q4993 TaxID=3039492 RepID=UPI0024BC6D2C|nr:hypothetical protein [Lentilactobacillus sp. Marseille-Q4993]
MSFKSTLTKLSVLLLSCFFLLIAILVTIQLITGPGVNYSFQQILFIAAIYICSFSAIGATCSLFQIAKIATEEPFPTAKFARLINHIKLALFVIFIAFLGFLPLCYTNAKDSGAPGILLIGTALDIIPLGLIGLVQLFSDIIINNDKSNH